MGMQWLEGELRKKAIEDPRADAWADVIAAMPKSLGYDMPMPVAGLETPPLKPRERINKIFLEYNRSPYYVEQVSKAWTELWEVWGEQLDIHVAVPSCDRTQEELNVLERQRRIMIYVPKELSGKSNIGRLSKLYPELIDYSDLYLPENTVDQHGWLDVELTTFDVPNPNMTESEVNNLFGSQDKTGQTLNTYMIGSTFNHKVTGNYYDEFACYSRLLSTTYQRKVVYVRGPMPPFGIHIEVDRNRISASGEAWREDRGSKDPHIGARSAGAKRAA